MPLVSPCGRRTVAVAASVSSRLRISRGIAFSHDSRFLIVGGRQTTAVFDIKARRVVTRWDAGEVETLAVSADGRRLVTATDESLSVWPLPPLLAFDAVQRAVAALASLTYTSDGTAPAPADLAQTLARLRERVDAP